MSARAYMIVGGVGGFCLSLVGVMFFDSQIAFAAFAAGALFGKGYGIWEERGRTALKDRARSLDTEGPGR